MPAYPHTFLPSLFLPLPASTFAAFVESLLDFLAFRLTYPHHELLQSDQPDERIKRATEILELIIGPAKVGGEAVEAVMRSVIRRKRFGGIMEDKEHARSRIIVGWVHAGGETG